MLGCQRATFAAEMFLGAGNQIHSPPRMGRGYKERVLHHVGQEKGISFLLL